MLLPQRFSQHDIFTLFMRGYQIFPITNLTRQYKQYLYGKIFKHKHDPSLRDRRPRRECVTRSRYFEPDPTRY